MRSHLTWMATAAALGLTAGHGLAQAPPAAQPSRPPIETTKVEGTDNVYIFRNVNHQSIFIVTKAGVIATDPVAYGRPHRRAVLRRRDQEGHQPADQVPDLQPPPLRPYRRRQGLQGCRRARHRAQACQGAARRHQRPAHGARGRGRDRCRPHHHARRHDGGAQVRRHQSLRLDAGDAAAEGEADLRRRSHSRGLGAGARHDRLLSDGIGGLDQDASWPWTGSA